MKPTFMPELPGDLVPGGFPVEEEVVEIPLLLSSWQVQALEELAHERGLTTAGMVRHLVNRYLRGTDRR